MRKFTRRSWSGFSPGSGCLSAMRARSRSRGITLSRGWARSRCSLWQHIDAGLVPALIKRDLQPAGHQPLLHVAASAVAGSNADQIHRAVADIVIAVAAEILRREFPVARDAPFLDAAQYLG